MWSSWAITQTPSAELPSVVGHEDRTCSCHCHRLFLLCGRWNEGETGKEKRWDGLRAEEGCGCGVCGGCGADCSRGAGHYDGAGGGGGCGAAAAAAAAAAGVVVVVAAAVAETGGQVWHA